MSRTDRIVTGWTRIYTAGLPDGARERRREEIASDLWEHRAVAHAAGRSAGRTGLAIASRCIRGIPADLSWRRGVARDRRLPARLAAAAGWALASAGAAFLVVVPAVLVVTLLAGEGARDEPGWAPFAIGAAAIVVAQAAGVGLGIRRRRLGAGVFTAGLWGVCGLMFWAWPVMIPAAAVATAGVWRLTARRAQPV